MTESLLKNQYSLTTPDLKNLSQNFFHGENWFCYWKSSSTLWSSKIEQYQGPTPMFVPLLWSHHVHKIAPTGSETQYKISVDFGHKKQDTNISEVFKLSQSMGIEAVLVIPIGPLPFVSAGGLPSWLCESISLNKEGFAKIAIDDQQRIHKSYSFYSPKVFKEFVQMLSVLADQINSKGLSVKVYSMNSFYINPTTEKLESFFEDYSETAEQSLARYFASLKIQEKNLQNSKVTDKQWMDFHMQMQNLYTQAIKEIFAGNYQHNLQVAFSKSSHYGALSAMSMGSQDFSCLDFIKTCWQSSMIPSFVTGNYGTTPITKLYQATCPHDWLKDFTNSRKNDLNQNSYIPLKLLEVMSENESLDKIGLYPILCESFHGSWSYISKFTSEEVQSWELPKTIIIQDIASNISEDKFQNSCQDPFVQTLIRAIMGGHQLAVNREALTANQIRLLEQFFIQNQLRKILVNHYCPMEFISIGQAGKICLFNGSEIKNSTKDLQKAFWKQIVKLFEIHFVPWTLNSEIEVLWLEKEAGTQDLYYEQMRRVILFNKSHDAKELSITRDKKHFLVKIIDPTNAEVITKPQSIEINFQSQGFVILDFGFVSECN